MPRQPERRAPSRRALIGTVGAACAARMLAWPQAARAAAAPPTGWVRPRLALPDVGLQLDDGHARALPALLAGKVSAVQLMFTGCSTSCPPQGALFAALAARLPAQGFQLLSISIDALGDDAAALGGWLQRFGHPPRWQAGVPRVAEVDALARFLKGTASGADAHTAQVFVVDREGRLCYRTGDAPEAGFVAALLAHVAAGGG